VLDFCWKHRGVLVTAEKCLHGAKASPTAPPVSGLGVHEGQGGGTAGTADPS